MSKPKPWTKPTIHTIEKPGASPKPMPPEPKGDPKK